MIESSRAPRSKTLGLTWFGVLVPLFFAAVVLIGISRHELWRDEAKAWLIARHSDSLSDLFNNRRYEGHPIAWYALLFCASRVSASPVVMQILHSFIATAGILVFVRWAPLGKTAKALFASGIFPMYEYAIVSRNYALGILLLFCLLALFASSRRKRFTFAVLLCALANTSMYGLFFAVALATAWVVRDVISDQWRTSDARGRIKDLLAATIAIAGCVVAFLQIVPPPPATAADGHRLQAFSETRFSGVGMQEAVSRVWDTFVPIPTWRYRQFYGNILRAPNRIALTARCFAGLLILGAALVALRRSPAAFTFFAVAALAMISFEAFMFDGGLRHHGHLFIAMIAALWLWQSMTERRLPSRWNAALLMVLIVHAGVGAWYLISDLGLPFSPSVATADLLQQKYGRNFDLIADPANFASPVEAYLDVPVYFPARGSWGTFEILDGTPKRATPEQLRNAMRHLVAHAKRPVVLLSADIVSDPGDEIVLVPIASEPWSLSWEGWQLYEVRQKPDNEAGSPDMWP